MPRVRRAVLRDRPPASLSVVIVKERMCRKQQPQRAVFVSGAVEHHVSVVPELDVWCVSEWW